MRPMKGNTRRSVVVLAVVAMVAGLLALPALPASAAAATASYTADFSACPAGVIPSAGFTDTTSSFAMANIDCVAYYGITKGTSATTYDPASPVTRWQMALFLTRAAGPAGITLGAGADQGFTDISGLPAEYQTAINQLAELGITKGTSATTFSPDGVVTREQMALFIRRFLADAVRGPGEGLTALIAGADGATDFTDVAGTSFEAHNAITDLFELGVTTGTTATTFSPGLSVSREQMAAFISRSLAHTNARPAGVSMQVVPTSSFSGDAVDVAISVRSSTFQPVANALLDVFEAATKNASSAFKSDGTCDTGYVSLSFGATVCAIDVSDPDTNSYGNYEDTFAPTASTTWWAWTGASGATFDADTTAFATGAVSVSEAATDWEITDNVNKYAAFGDANSTGLLGWEDGGLVKFGTTVTLTAQLVDASGDPVALAGEDIWLGSSLSIDDVWQGDTVYHLVSDASGKATVSFTHSDPSSTADNATIEEWYVVNDGGYGVTDDTNALFADDYVWEDDAAEPTTLVAGVSGLDYTTGTSLVAKATVYDQYGIGDSGVDVVFDDNNGFTSPDRYTNSSGVAQQTITETAGSGTYTIDVAADSGALTDSVDMFFATAASSGAIGGPFAIQSADDVNSKIVANDMIYPYDSGDFFYVNGGATSYTDFVDDLAYYTTLDGTYNSSGISTFYVVMP